MPIPDRLLGLLINADTGQLGQRDCQRAISVPARHDEHLVLANFRRGHPQDFHLVADPKWRCGTLGDATSSERELELLLEIVVPAHCLFLWAVSIDDDLHRDALLA